VRGEILIGGNALAAGFLPVAAPATLAGSPASTFGMPPADQPSKRLLSPVGRPLDGGVGGGDRFFATGDLGEVLQDGGLCLLGRMPPAFTAASAPAALSSASKAGGVPAAPVAASADIRGGPLKGTGATAAAGKTTGAEKTSAANASRESGAAEPTFAGAKTTGAEILKKASESAASTTTAVKTAEAGSKSASKAAGENKADVEANKA
jgi:hypothetical protein